MDADTNDNIGVNTAAAPSPSPPPPPPSDRPAIQLRRQNSAPQLRKYLVEQGLPTNGSKADMSLRLAAHIAFVEAEDVASAFTRRQLLQRTKLRGGSKEVLSADICKTCRRRRRT